MTGPRSTVHSISERPRDAEVLLRFEFNFCNYRNRVGEQIYKAVSAGSGELYDQALALLGERGIEFNMDALSDPLHAEHDNAIERLARDYAYELASDSSIVACRNALRAVLEKRGDLFNSADNPGYSREALLLGVDELVQNIFNNQILTPSQTSATQLAAEGKHERREAADLFWDKKFKSDKLEVAIVFTSSMLALYIYDIELPPTVISAYQSQASAGSTGFAPDGDAESGRGAALAKVVFPYLASFPRVRTVAYWGNLEEFRRLAPPSMADLLEATG